MIAHLVESQSNDFVTFQGAMEVARNWSAYACTKLGGAAECPNQQELTEFVKQYSSNTKSVVESVQRDVAEKYLMLIDTDYQH